MQGGVFMIIADSNRLAPFKAISKNIQLAIEHLEEVNTKSIEDGKYYVLGDDIFVVVSSYLTREHNESKYEAHLNYIDIQCLISGEELIFCNEERRMETDGDYNAVSDKINFKDKTGDVSIHMRSGMVAIFFPNDSHKACCMLESGPGNVRKLLIKVRV